MTEMIIVRRTVFTCLLVICVTGGQSASADWQAHHVRQKDGHQGWVTWPAQRQALKSPGSTYTMPFGLVQMDNGEVAILCSHEFDPPKGVGKIQPIIAFSNDGGATWSDFIVIAGASGRPMNLTDHGKGRLSFVSNDKPPFRRHFSNDYGRTWPEIVDHPGTKNGMGFNVEGNGWVDRDDQGRAVAILELGDHYAPGKSYPKDDATVVFRRSIDGAKTWTDEVAPPEWKFTAEHDGKKWLRGVHEGAVARAANGDLVAALRTSEPPHYFLSRQTGFNGPSLDNLCGTAISISADDGKTWSEMQFLFQSGRHHANLQRLPNGSLVCTLIVRNDIEGDKQVSNRRGCDALVSKDNGKTWNLDRRYELDGFDYEATINDRREDGALNPVKCGHIGAVALRDGHMISAYGHYPLGASVLIKWRPDGESEKTR